MNFPNPMPNKDVVNPDTNEITQIPMTQEEYIEAMPKFVYPIEGA